jgi:hypothetical protein
VKLKLKQEINNKKRIDLTNKFASAQVETVRYPGLVFIAISSIKIKGLKMFSVPHLLK